MPMRVSETSPANQSFPLLSTHTTVSEQHSLADQHLTNTEFTRKLY